MDSQSAAIPQIRTSRARTVRGKLLRTFFIYGIGVALILAVVGRHRDNRRQNLAIQDVEKFVSLLRPVVTSTGTLPYELPVPVGESPPKSHDDFIYDPPARPMILRQIDFPLIVGATPAVGMATRSHGRVVAVFHPPKDEENADIEVVWMSNGEYDRTIDTQTAELARIQNAKSPLR